MRAVFYTGKISEKIELGDEQVHHLKNVLRVKEADEILVLNGKGLKCRGKVQNIGKKNIEIEIFEQREVAACSGLELAIGLPKKEVFEDICRMAVEMGVCRVYAVKCEYSQWKYQFSERLEKILISACLQSNNPWLPTIEVVESVENLLKLNKSVIPMDLSPGKTTKNKISNNSILLIGPEAGFSSGERELFHNLQVINLPGPILRASTAVPLGIGYLMGILAEKTVSQ